MTLLLSSLLSPFTMSCICLVPTPLCITCSCTTWSASKMRICACFNLRRISFLMSFSEHIIYSAPLVRAIINASMVLVSLVVTWFTSAWISIKVFM